MKKIILLLLVFFAFNITAIKAADEEAAVSEDITVSETAQNDSAFISGNEKVEIIEQNGKYGIRDKETHAPLLAAEWDSVEPLDDFVQFKIKRDDKIGYCNLELKTIFLAPMEDVKLLGDYVKIKNKGRYGVTDKAGNILLSPIYQKVAIIKNGDDEYFSAKINGKYRVFYTSGKTIGAEEDNTIIPVKLKLLITDVRDVFKDSYTKKVALAENTENNEDNINKTETEAIEAINTQTAAADEIEVPQILKIASIKKDVIIKSENEKTSEYKHGLQGLLTIRNKDYVIVKNNGKIGLSYESNMILPAEFDTITLKTPCFHFLYPVIIVNKGNTYYAYNTSGKLLSEAADDIVKVYRLGKTYVYNNGIVSKDGKEIGNYEVNEKGYKFIRKGCIIPPHIVNELILTMLTIEK